MVPTLPSGSTKSQTFCWQSDWACAAHERAPSKQRRSPGARKACGKNAAVVVSKTAPSKCWPSDTRMNLMFEMTCINCINIFQRRMKDVPNGSKWLVTSWLALVKSQTRYDRRYGILLPVTALSIQVHPGSEDAALPSMSLAFGVACCKFSSALLCD